MKKVLILGCVILLLLGSSTYAANYEETYSKAVELSTALGTSDNVQELLGEAVILMIENDVLNELSEKGEAEYASELKSSADTALDASATGAADAREKAIDFCDKLIGTQEIIPVETKAIKLTAESQNVSVTELEHYALTVNNAQLSDTPITVTVEFRDGDSAIQLENVLKFDGKSATTYSSLSRTMVKDNNVFNFTTPKGCTFVKVYASIEPLSATLAVTNEVINNGSVVRVAKQSTFGWYTANNTMQDADNDYFCTASKVSTEIKQSFFLKAGSTYRLKFKAAISGIGTYSYPHLTFAGDSGSVISLPTNTSWEDLAISPTSLPGDEYWQEYEAYFIAGESDDSNPSMAGLVQRTLVPRCYSRTDGANYYDDFSIEEIDKGSYIWYEDKNGVSVSGKSKAKTIHYHYVQNETGKTQKLIHAKYIDDSLSTIELIEVGKDLAVGESRDYDIEITESESKIFLWDGKTLVPQRLPIENYVIID